MARNKEPSMHENVAVPHPGSALLYAAGELLCGYFRMEARGLEKIPKTGPAIIIANHSGFAGADAIVLSHLIHSRRGRELHILAHPFYFNSLPWLRESALKFGLREASVESGMRCLQEGHLLLVFPEGERGNFKTSFRRYRLQAFHTGFVRMAFRTHAPVVPCTIVGAEESHLSLGNLDLGFLLRGLRLPIPLNLLPLPAKWRIRFFDPYKYQLSRGGHEHTQTWILRETRRTRHQLQEKLIEERERKLAA